MRRSQRRGTGIETRILHLFTTQGLAYQVNSAIGLVVKYLVANEVPRVRFPDGAYLARVAQLVAPRSYVPMVQGSSPCTSILDEIPISNPLCQISISNPPSPTSNGHTMVKPPDPIRTPKLSTIGPAQYCGGGPRGNRRCLFVFTFCFPSLTLT